MAWNLPALAVTGEVIPATWGNATRDSLNETAPAKASAAGDTFTASAANAIQRVAIGTAGQVYEVNSAATNARWSDIAIDLDTHRVMDY